MNKAQGMLGICARAGKLVSGSDACRIALSKKKAYLILVDSEASEATKKEMKDACAYRGVAFEIIQDFLLGEAIGKPERRVAAVTDEPFKNRIIQLLHEGR